jgi:ABC-type uncharacterized transport system substrate-binding protein
MMLLSILEDRTMQRYTVGLLITLALSLLLMPRVSNAQQTVKVPLLGILGVGRYPTEAQWQRSPFVQKLHELGWQEGHTIAVERRYAESQLERLPDLAADLVRLRPNVIVVVGGTPGVRAAQQATTTIPIVIRGAGLLVEQGIVPSLAHPGANITGVENNAVGLVGKRLEFLKAALPQSTRVAFLFNPANPFFHFDLPRAEMDAQALGLQLQPVAVRHADELDGALATLVDQRPDALFIGDDDLFYNHLRQITDFATTHQLPSAGGIRGAAEAGSLFTFGYSTRELWQRAAVYVDKILKGAKPGDLPIERPTKFELIINLKTAKALGITLSPTLLFQADEVIRED